MSTKAVYQFLFYPELSDVDPLCWALNAMCWNWRVSPLHDKDVKEDGSPKKAHYHVLVGFAKDAPDFKTFKGALDALDNPGIAVPPARECLVQDPMAAEDYQEHKNNPEKAQYSASDALESDAWNVVDYCTKDQKADYKRTLRQRQKQDKTEYKTEYIGYCMDWLSTPGNPCELSSLLDHLRKDRPEYFAAALDSSYVLKSYADSKRHCERDEEVRELQVKNEELQEELAMTSDKLCRMMNASQSLQQLAKDSAI